MTDQTKAPELPSKVAIWDQIGSRQRGWTSNVVPSLPHYIRADLAAEQVRAAYEQGIEAAANARGMWFGFNSSGEPTGEYCTVKAHDPGDMKLYISHDAIRALKSNDTNGGQS